MTIKPMGYHVGQDYAVILKTPTSHTDDKVANVYSDNAEKLCQLFSTSPELLDALKELHSAAIMFRDSIYKRNPLATASNEAVNMLSAYLRNAQKIINKAEGKS